MKLPVLTEFFNFRIMSFIFAGFEICLSQVFHRIQFFVKTAVSFHGLGKKPRSEECYSKSRPGVVDIVIDIEVEPLVVVDAKGRQALSSPAHR